MTFQTHKISLSFTVCFLAMSAITTSLRCEIFSISLKQKFLQKFYCLRDLVIRPIIVTTARAVRTTPKFEIFKPVIRTNSVFMMNSFFRQKTSAQMFFHYQSMFHYIAVACFRMVRLSFSDIPVIIIDFAAFPTRRFFARQNRFRLSCPTRTAHSRKLIFFNGVTNGLDFGLKTDFAFNTINSDKRSLTFSAFFVSFDLRIVLYECSYLFGYFVWKQKRFIGGFWFSTAFISAFFTLNSKAIFTAFVVPKFNEGFRLLARWAEFAYNWISHFVFSHTENISVRSIEKVQTFLCFVFNYTKVFHFLQSRILLTSKKHRLKNADAVERLTSPAKFANALNYGGGLRLID